MEPNFWEVPDKAQEQLRKVAGIKSWVVGFDEVKKSIDEVQLMPEFVSEGLATEEEADAAYAKAVELVEKLELKNMLSGEEDKMGAIVDINAGAGGTEALRV